MSFKSFLINLIHSFCPNRKVDWLTDKMRTANFTVVCMHGEMPQGERDEIMEKFRSGDSYDPPIITNVICSMLLIDSSPTDAFSSPPTSGLEVSMSRRSRW